MGIRRLVILGIATVISGSAVRSQNDLRHDVMPFHGSRFEHGVEAVRGDHTKPGMPYVIRIHNDAGYVVLPHTHPEDENIVVLRGSWSLGMGARVYEAALSGHEVGDYGFVPKKMAHFAWSMTATTIQVHGIGPFSTDWGDPAYVLTASGVALQRAGGTPGEPVQSAPADCFALTVGTRVRGRDGEGVVMGGICSPANRLTQYRIQKASGERFWAAVDDLVKM